MFLAQGYNKATRVRIVPLASESEALPLGYRASTCKRVVSSLVFIAGSACDTWDFYVHV